MGVGCCRILLFVAQKAVPGKILDHFRRQQTCGYCHAMISKSGSVVLEEYPITLYPRLHPAERKHS